MEGLGVISGHLGGQDGSKSRPSDPTCGVKFRLEIWSAIFWLTGSVAQATVAELQAPVQLFSWRKLEELEVIPYAMHHGMMRRIPLPSANPATALEMRWSVPGFRLEGLGL